MTGTIKSIVAYHDWKSIPLVVGGKDGLPRFKDLVEFEELDDYSLISAKRETSAKPSKTCTTSRKRQKRKKKLNALKRKLVSEEDDTQHALQHTLPRKKQKQEPCILTSTVNEQSDSFDVKCDVSAWEALYVCTEIQKSLSEMGFSQPMAIQEQVLPTAIRDKRDVLGAAETGSGKTLAFGIPLLHHLMEDKNRNIAVTTAVVKDDQSQDHEKELGSDVEDVPEPRENQVELEMEAPATGEHKVLAALVLTPTRELAIQVKNHLSKVAKYTGLSLVAVVGGMSKQKQIRLLNRQPDVVIATPGRLHDLMDAGHPYLNHLHKLRYLVIDEADRMLEHGHFEELAKLLSVINAGGCARRKRQNYVFSATLTTIHQGPNRKSSKTSQAAPSKGVKLEKLTKAIGMREKPLVVDLTTTKVTAEKLTEAKILCEVDEKDFYLYYFMKSCIGRTLVFTNSIDCIFRLSGILSVLGCQPQHIHAKMQQRQRLKHLERFQASDNAVMIASDVAARGLDIPDVKHVIHYQVPRTMETYIHRSGRSARSGKDGLSLMLVSPGEMHFYKRLCHSLKKVDGLPVYQVDHNYLAAIKKRVNIARDVDKLSHKIKKANLHNDWFVKAAKEIEVELDEDVLVDNNDAVETQRIIASKKQQLAALLQRPIFPKGFSGKFITRQGELKKTILIPDAVGKSVKSHRPKRKKR